MARERESWAKRPAPPWWPAASRLTRLLQELDSNDLRALVYAIDRRERTHRWSRADLAWYVAKSLTNRLLGPRTLYDVVLEAAEDPRPLPESARQRPLPLLV